jgi:hypothetical protein
MSMNSPPPGKGKLLVFAKPKKKKKQKKVSITGLMKQVSITPPKTKPRETIKQFEMKTYK